MTKTHQSRPSTATGLLRHLIPSPPFQPFGRVQQSTSPKFNLDASSLGSRSTMDYEGHIPRHTEMTTETPFHEMRAESTPPILRKSTSYTDLSVVSTPRRIPAPRKRFERASQDDDMEILASPSPAWTEQNNTFAYRPRRSLESDTATQGTPHPVFHPYDDLPIYDSSLSITTLDPHSYSPPPALRPLSTISQFHIEHPLLFPVDDAPPLPSTQRPLKGTGLQIITAVSPSAIIGDTRQSASPAESLHRQSHIAELGRIRPSIDTYTTDEDEVIPALAYAPNRTATAPVRPPRSVHRAPPPIPSPYDDSDDLRPPNINRFSQTSSMYYSSNHSNTSIASAQVITAERASTSSVTISTVSTAVWVNGVRQRAVAGVLPFPNETESEISAHSSAARSPPSQSTSNHATSALRHPNQSTTSLFTSSIYTQPSNPSSASLTGTRIPLHKRLLRPMSRAQIVKTPQPLDTIPTVPPVTALRSIRSKQLINETPQPTDQTFGRPKRIRPGTALPKLRKSVDVLKNIGRPSTANISPPPPLVARKASKVLGLEGPSGSETTKLKLTPAWLSPGARNEDNILTIPGSEYEYIDQAAREARKKEIRVGGYRGRKISMKPDVSQIEGSPEPAEGDVAAAKEDVDDQEHTDTIKRIVQSRPALPNLWKTDAPPKTELDTLASPPEASSSRLSITPPNATSVHDGSSSPASSPDPVTPTLPTMPSQHSSSTPKQSNTLPRTPFPSSGKPLSRGVRAMTAQPLHIPDRARSDIETPKKVVKYSLDISRSTAAGSSKLLPPPSEIRAVQFDTPNTFVIKRSIETVVGRQSRPSSASAFNPRASEPNLLAHVSETSPQNGIFSTRAYSRSSASLTVAKLSRYESLDTEYRPGYEPVEGFATQSPPTQPTQSISRPSIHAELSLREVPERLRRDVQEYILEDQAKKAALWGKQEERSKMLQKPFGRVRWATVCTKRAVVKGMSKVPFL